MPHTGDDPTSFEGWTTEGHLGQGGFGIVLKGRLKDGTPVAVKAMNKHELVAIHEASLMSPLKHEHIVKCYGHREIEAKGVGNAKVEIFLELCTPLRDVWTDENQSNSELIRDYIRQVVLGLQHLHDRKIAHHDIKLDNVLVGGDGLIKIADFGCSKAMGTLTMQRGGRQPEIVGTPSHMAPEIVANVLESKDPHYGVKADVWALGCLVLELHGKQPWTIDPNFCNDIIVQYSLKHRDSQSGFPENAPKQGECTPELWDFYSRVFERDPARRATCAELLECDWLRVSSINRKPETLNKNTSAHNLTTCTPPSIKLRESAEHDSFVLMLEINYNNAAAWYNLGKALRGDDQVKIKDTWYNRQEC